MIGVGMSSRTEPRQAVAEALAMAEAQGRGPWGWALAFCAGRHPPEVVAAELRERLGAIPLVGGSAAGTITDRALGYGGYELAVMLFPAARGEPALFLSGDLREGEEAVGRELGERLAAAVEDDDHLLLFYDVVDTAGVPPRLHLGNPLLEGIYAGLGGRQPRIVGAGLLGDLQITLGYLFDGIDVAHHRALAVVLPRSIALATTIMHGCQPVSGLFTITRLAGPVVYELDGRPALAVLRDFIGEEVGPDSVLRLLLTLGERQGDPFAADGAYVTRVVTGFDPAAGSVTLFEAGFRAGSRVEVMIPDQARMLGSVTERSRGLLASRGGSRPLAALYIACAGRCAAFSGSDGEEMTGLQAAMAEAGVPLLGFYSGVEVAPTPDRACPLNLTGVLNLLVAR